MPADLGQPGLPDSLGQFAPQQGPVFPGMVSHPPFALLLQDELVDAVASAVRGPVPDLEGDTTGWPTYDPYRRGRWTLPHQGVVVPDGGQEEATWAELRHHPGDTPPQVVVRQQV